MEDVSVIIPTYNRASTILRSVNSVLCQSTPPREIVIVDDGSTDATESLIKSLEDPSIIYLKQTNRGQNAARNLGLESANSPWVAFHDSDDQMMPGKLKTIFSKIRAIESEHGSALNNVAIFHAYKRVVEDELSQPTIVPRSLVDRFPQGFNNMQDNFDQMEILLGNFLSSQTLVIGREKLKGIGGWNESLRRYTDWELAIRIADSLKLIFISEPLVNVYVQNDSASHSVEQGHVSRKYIFQLHKDLYRKNPKKYIRQWLRIQYRSLINR